MLTTVTVTNNTVETHLVKYNYVKFIPSRFRSTKFTVRFFFLEKVWALLKGSKAHLGEFFLILFLSKIVKKIIKMNK